MGNDEAPIHLEQELEPRRHARLRRALEFALQHADQQATMDAMIGALGALIENHDDAVAFEMAQVAIHALVGADVRDREAVRVWHAVAAGCDPNQDAIAILNLAKEVDQTAFLFAASSPAISPRGTAAVAAFQTLLTERFGDGIPAVDTLLQWFSRLRTPRSRGGLTPAGVVARIVHHARLFGARRNDPEKTRKRVERVLGRTRKSRN